MDRNIFHRQNTESQFYRRTFQQLPVMYGIPQGSVLRLVLFLLYTVDVITIARRHDIGVHSNSDDTLLCQNFMANMFVARIPRLVSCIDNINRRMSSNRLKLNLDKTDLILLGTRHQLVKINCKSTKINGCESRYPIRSPALVPGRWRDNICRSHQMFKGSMFLPALTAKYCSSCFDSRSYQDAGSWFIVSHVDYCNNVLGSTSAVHLCPLQSVLNAAAHSKTKIWSY